MAKSSPSSNLYSHPGKLLEDHLIGVANLAKLFIDEKPLEIRSMLSNVSRIVALSHDLGKATQFFQIYLCADEREKARIKKQRQTQHSLFSAVCSYYLAKELNAEGLLPFFAFLVVKRHHGDLRDIMDDVIFDNKDAELLQEQLGSIDDAKFRILSAKLGLSLRLNKTTISQWIDSFIAESMAIKKYLRNIDGDITNYLILNMLYSTLLDADKSDVVIDDPNVFKTSDGVKHDWVDVYKSKVVLPDSPINYLREKAYQETINKEINLADRIYSLTLPTGLGKTLTGLSFALKLRERVKVSTGKDLRIIYSLPFLSIIDQNFNVFEEVVKANGIESDTSVLLKHHHLAEVFYNKEKEEFETDEAKILIEGWNAEIIVTTFIQLFHTLIGNKNKSLRKFHRFANSIIMLDEIQAIPVKYWLLLKEILLEIATDLNAYILLMTATEPLIFDKGRTRSLVEKDLYFKSLDRILMKPQIDRDMTLAELANYFNLNDGKSYLFILNTITAAKEFYNLIKKRDIPLTYLSTHITPKARLARIQEIKENKFKVVVSTQLVEAGIDIDFDIVVRDLAPLDSINQAAGRCNRNSKYKGDVFVVSLKDDKGSKYASYIYDCVLLDITRKILASRDVIKESDFLQIIENFYSKTQEKKSQDISRELLEAVCKLRYDTDDNKDGKLSISHFQLIEEDYLKKDIFIELDGDAGKIWNQYLRLKEVEDPFLRKKTFDKIKADFYQYVISTPIHLTHAVPSYGEIGYIKQTRLCDFYDSATGFVTKDTRSVVIW